MRVLVTTESRFERTPDGVHWNVGSANYEFWTRYLEVFEHIAVLARVQNVGEPPENAVRADGPGVSMVSLPYYLGPWGYLRCYHSLSTACRRAIQPDDAVIVRAP